MVKGPAALKTCPGWHAVDGKMVPNLKSSGAKTNAPSFDLMLLSFSSAIDSIYNATVSFYQDRLGAATREPEEKRSFF